MCEEKLHVTTTVFKEMKTRTEVGRKYLEFHWKVTFVCKICHSKVLMILTVILHVALWQNHYIFHNLCLECILHAKP